MDYGVTELLTRYSEGDSKTWRLFEKLRQDKGKRFSEWPDWCFIPSSVLQTTSEKALNRELYNVEYTALHTTLMLAAWRTTQGIYQFDPDVFLDVWETPASEKIPIEILYNLPEWCIYIPTPFKELAGFFVSLDYSEKTQLPTLSFLLNLNEPINDTRVIRLRLEGFIDQSIRNNLPQPSTILDKPSTTRRDGTELFHFLEPLISLTLYVASQNAHIEHPTTQQRPSYPVTKKTKKGERLFPPDKPTTWEVGYRLGAALRQAEAEIQNKTQSNQDKAVSRPHIRRAHWHTYWTGPKTKDQTPILKWLPPIPVNIDLGEIVPTVRPVLAMR
jgi:hypothetical protein